MSKYSTIRDASEVTSFTQYAIRKAIKQGSVRFFITKSYPQNISVTMVNIEDLKYCKNLNDNEFIPTGVICQKYHIHRSTMHYHRTTGAVRWQKRRKKIYIHRKDWEELFASLHRLESD